MSRTGLKRLVMLLVLTGLLTVAGGVFWISSFLHQQALLEHDLQRQYSFAGQLASMLQRRLQHGEQDDLLADLVMDEQQRAWIVNAGGKTLYPN